MEKTTWDPTGAPCLDGWDAEVAVCCLFCPWTPAHSTLTVENGVLAPRVPPAPSGAPVKAGPSAQQSGVRMSGVLRVWVPLSFRTGGYLYPCPLPSPCMCVFTCVSSWLTPVWAPAVCLVPQEMNTGKELGNAAAGGENAREPNASTLRALGLLQPDFHSLVLDMATLSFVDTVCLKCLKNIFRDFREIEVEVYLAACHTPVVAQLEAGHFFDASITKRHLFPTVHDAVVFALQHPRTSPASPVLVTKL